jgi:hypothetical protein
MSPDGRRIALAWADEEARYSIRVVDADGRNARVVYEDSAYYYMEVNGFAPDGRHVIVELDRRNGLFDYGWLDLDGGGIRVLFKDVPWVLGDVLFSPDSRYAAYSGSRRTERGAARRAHPGSCDGAYVAAGDVAERRVA